MLFYSNKNVCVGFVGWFLYTLLLLKIIVSMKIMLCGYLEVHRKMCGVCVCTGVCFCGLCVSWFPLIHTTVIVDRQTEP